MTGKPLPPRAGDLADVRTLYETGRAASREGRLRHARTALNAALAALPGTAAGGEPAELRARILISLAYVVAQLDGPDAASDRLAEAAAEVEAHDLFGLELLLRMQRGLILLRSGEFSEAVKAFDDGAAYRGAAASEDWAVLLGNRAVAHLELGDIGAARDDLTRCLRAAKGAGLEVLTLHATHNLGFVEFLAGDLPAALNLMDSARRMNPGVSPGVALLGKAQVLVEAGLLRDADEAFGAAAAIFRTERVERDLGEAELERARCAFARGDIASARELARAARKRFARTGGEPWRRGAELLLLQSDLAFRRRLDRLVQSAAELQATFSAEGLRLHARIAGLTAVEGLLRSDRRTEAAELLLDLGPSRRADPITGRMHTHLVHAQLHAAAGRRADARRRVRRALDELARYQATFGSIDLRTASAVHGRRLAELDITVALDGGRPASVFAAAERARAVSSRLPAVRPPDDPVAADLLAELRQNLEALRAVEQDRTASEPLLRKRRDLERAIVARSWTVSGSGAVERPATLDAVRAGLADRGRAMVTYVQAAGRLSAVVVGERARVHDLGAAAPVIEQVRRIRADLDVLAHPGLPPAMRAAVRASLERSLDAVDSALVGPLAVPGPLVLVSTGTLGQLPWASLPTLRGRSIVVAPSATKWLSSTTVAASAGAVAAVAGPDLPRGAEEAAAVGRAWPKGDVRDGAAATAAALTDAMMTADVLHVAAHGVHQPENPLFSSVRMVDGPVFAHELDRNGRAPSHVVLSACEVGLATIRPGDEALGLASVLLHLGTRSVIAGVARVGDDIAADTMAAYHRKLAAGADSSTALADALVEADTDVTPPFVNFGAAWAANLETASPVA